MSIADKTFVSYSRADKAFVQRLAAELREAGVDLWIDIFAPAPRSSGPSRPKPAMGAAVRPAPAPARSKQFLMAAIPPTWYVRAGTIARPAQSAALEKLAALSLGSTFQQQPD